MEDALTKARQSILQAKSGYKPITTEEARVQSLLHRALTEEEKRASRSYASDNRNKLLQLVTSDDSNVHRAYEDLKRSSGQRTSLFMSPNEELLLDIKLKAQSWMDTKRTQPILCPLKNCNQSVHFTDYLNHYFKVHESRHFKYQEIFTKENFSINFCPSVINLNENFCFHMLLYAGLDGKSHTLPCKLGMCQGNTNLEEDLYKWHLPVLIMASRIQTRMKIIESPDKEHLRRNSFLYNKPDAKVFALFDHQDFVFWLASLETKNRLFAKLTISSSTDLENPIIRSKKMQVRRMTEPRDPLDFMDNDINHLLIKGGEMRRMTDGANENINLEVELDERF